MDDVSVEDTGNVPAVDRAIAVLEYLTKQKSATIKDISNELSIPPASAGRIIKTLLAHDFLIEKQGKMSAKYSLGLRMLYFSQIVYQQLDIVNIAHEYMETLSESTNQASQLAIIDKNSVMYIEMVLPLAPVSIVAPLRTPLPLNLSAGGKVLLAGMDTKSQLNILESTPLIHATEKSIIDKESFILHLHKVKEEGYAIDDEEYACGIGCLAAPIYNYLGKVVAAVGITGPIALYKQTDSFESLLDAVFLASKSISKELGFSFL